MNWIMIYESQVLLKLSPPTGNNTLNIIIYNVFYTKDIHTNNNPNLCYAVLIIFQLFVIFSTQKQCILLRISLTISNTDYKAGHCHYCETSFSYLDSKNVYIYSELHVR